MQTLRFLIVFGVTLLWISIANLASPVSARDNTVQLLLAGYVTPIAGRELVPGVDEENGGRRVASTIGLVRGKDVTVIVDPGFVANTSLLLQALQKNRVNREQVTHVFISHHHPDHTINAAFFPHATVVDFWATYKGDVWQDHADNYVIAPGITVMRTPGHTNEDASLVVETSHGIVVFTHVWWFLSDGTLVPQGLFPPVDPIADNQEALNSSRSRIRDIADCIIPGHGQPFPNPFKAGAVCQLRHDNHH